MGKEVNRSWVIVGVALSVAIAASLITAGITGSIVKSTTQKTMTEVVNQFQKKGVEVYTKQEMDTALKGTATYSGVLDILADCDPVRMTQGNCKQECLRSGKVALNTLMIVQYHFKSSENQKYTFAATWLSPTKTISEEIMKDLVREVGGKDAIYYDGLVGCNCCGEVVPTPSPTKTPGRMNAPAASEKFLI